MRLESSAQMRPFRKPTLVTLRRQNPNQAWGFRLGGGAELGQAFQIQKVCPYTLFKSMFCLRNNQVTPGSLAFLGGISENDELVRIGNISLRGLTHDEVQQIILRCTNCIDLFLVRYCCFSDVYLCGFSSSIFAEMKAARLSLAFCRTGRR